MYREALALSIHTRRPDFEVLLAPPRPFEGRAASFGPHVLVHNAEGAGPPPARCGRRNLVSGVEITVTYSRGRG